MSTQSVLGSDLHRSIDEAELDHWRSLPAEQQPRWSDRDAGRRASRLLAGAPALVTEREIDGLRERLTAVAEGRALVIQAGDCAEDPGHAEHAQLWPKIELIRALAAALGRATGRPVVPVGRIAGQFAKPRSQPTELVGALPLPVFRGLMINGAEPDAEARRHDAGRLLSSYRAASMITRVVRSQAAEIWTSHDALVLDYEVPSLRRTADGRLLLTSTHWPWIGERTRQLHGAHVRLLEAIDNPVAVKVGPGIDPDALVELCARLDPHRRPGRLTLIVRLGADRVRHRLPALVEAVRAAAHPVIWLCDPMHGNTVRTPGGLKTRVLDTVAAEITAFRAAIEAGGAVAGGLHLEVTPDPVVECVRTADEVPTLDGNAYRSLCDPRLDAGQAHEMVRVWARSDTTSDRRRTSGQPR